jgi:hypothetical protein
LDAYLRSLNAVAPLERVMFLAEDCMFGHEIVLARDKSWRLGYCPAAEATTDACDTFGEPLRQRRRWQTAPLPRASGSGDVCPPFLSRPLRRDPAREGAVRRLDALAAPAYRLGSHESGLLLLMVT